MPHDCILTIVVTLLLVGACEILLSLHLISKYQILMQRLAGYDLCEIIIISIHNFNLLIYATVMAALVI